MYLFTRRTRTVAGDQRGAIAWATEITAKANQISGLAVNLSTPVFGEGVGGIVWATFVETMAQLEDANDKLQLDDGFVEVANKGAKFTNGLIDDSLLQVIHGTPDPGRQLTHVTAVTAVGATGKLVRSIELGVEIAQRAEAITGLPTMFGSASTGPYGGVAWLTGYESIDAVQAGADALAGDTDWLNFLDKELPGVYVEDPSITQQALYRIIG